MTNSSPASTRLPSPLFKPDRVKGKRGTCGLNLLRRALGKGVSLNLHTTFSPSEAVGILLELDRRLPRKHRTPPKYLDAVVNQLRK